MDRNHKAARKLSQVVDKNSFSDGTSLSLNFKDIVDLDTIPGFYLKATQLNLEYNRLFNLDGIWQFKNLTHLWLGHNQLSDTEELRKILNPFNLCVLSVPENPISIHPRLTAICMSIFPHLKELNGQSIDESTRKDLAESLILSKKIIQFFYKSESVVAKRDRDLKNLKIKLEMFQYLKAKNGIDTVTGPFHEDVNAVHSKLIRNIPMMPTRPHHSSAKKVRPGAILKFIESYEDFLEAFSGLEIDNLNSYKGLFCEILMHMHSNGNEDLQLYLQRAANKSGTLSEQFESQFQEFIKLVPQKNYRIFVPDIYPKKRLPGAEAIEENEFLFNEFPIFSNYPEFLSACLNILENQVNAICDMSEEYVDLLRFNTNTWLPSFSEQHFSPCTPDILGNRRQKCIGNKSPRASRELTERKGRFFKVEPIPRSPQEEKLLKQSFKALLVESLRNLANKMQKCKRFHKKKLLKKVFSQWKSLKDTRKTIRKPLQWEKATRSNKTLTRLGHTHDKFESSTEKCSFKCSTCRQQRSKKLGSEISKLKRELKKYKKTKL